MGMSWARTLVQQMAVLAAAAICSSAAFAQLPFFPGAEGFGGTFTGTAPAAGWFSNAQVYHVTTTADIIDAGTGKPAQGTLRGAFYDYTQPNSPKQMATNRIVVFDVGGTFQLTQGVLDIKTQNNIYVAGQTAPSPVVIYGDSTQITHSNNTMNSNFIMRYLTFRRGSVASGNEDAVTFKSSNSDGTGSISTNMILDHISTSWGTDENLSVANNNTNITVQYSMLNDALRSDHAFGSLIRPRVNSNVTYHHNLYANNASRQARFGSYKGTTLTADFRNNVVYNYRDRASYAGGSDETEQEFADVNYVGNYIIAGPATGTNTGPNSSYVGPGIAFKVDKNITASVHQYANAIDPNGPAPPGQADATDKYNGTDTGWGMFSLGAVTDQSLTHVDDAQFLTAPVTTQTADSAYLQLIGYVGNSWWNRDTIDARVIQNVTQYTGVPVGATDPIESERLSVVNAPVTTRAASWDTDGDGMPNAWEAAHGLNPNSSADKGLDFDGDGYVNVQEYVDEIGAFPAPTPLTYVGPASGPAARFALITNWKTADLIEPTPNPAVPDIVHSGTNWQPSKYDEVQINSGTVVVDAVGQHAGVLKIGATAGSNGHLQVNSGWLEVADTIVVGAHASGQGTLTLGGGQVVADAVVVGVNGQLRGAGTLTGDVTNSGVVLPGSSPGTLTIEGNFTQLVDGDLSIDLASAVSYDKLVVLGNITHGGLLQINLLDGYVPTEGTEFDVIDWTGTQSEAFNLLALPDLGTALTWDYSLIDSQGVLKVVAASAPILAGDYNDDGTVDAADYTVWRDKLGAGGSLLNETESIGTIDNDDYLAWKTNFGTTSGVGSGSIGSVPEPTGFLLFAMALAILAVRRRGRRLGS